MSSTATDALSPLDGRYSGKLTEVRRLFCEAGLLRERVRVECAWMLALADGPAAKPLAALPREARSWLETLARDPGGTDAAAIKRIEARTNHDVKAVEYWIREQLQARGIPVRISRESQLFTLEPAAFEIMEDSQWQRLAGRGELTIL